MVEVGPGITNVCNGCGIAVNVDQSVKSESVTGEVLCIQCYNAEMKEME